MLKSLFRPKSAAVIGASSKELSIGNRVIRNLIDFGFKGEIYPINPSADEIRGLALEYGLASDFTSFLAVDASEVTAGDHGTTLRVPAPMPRGVRYDTTISGSR